MGLGKTILSDMCPVQSNAIDYPYTESFVLHSVYHCLALSYTGYIIALLYLALGISLPCITLVSNLSLFYPNKQRKYHLHFTISDITC